jgi:hypothetical protein
VARIRTPPGQSLITTPRSLASCPRPAGMENACPRATSRRWLEQHRSNKFVYKEATRSRLSTKWQLVIQTFALAYVKRMTV